ncbi:MAG: hypothetical protein HC794_08385 [Nitrospiraceae bacterium]|nr:hypothetical protein [Nitrospiraceae bacterium]
MKQVRNKRTSNEQKEQKVSAKQPMRRQLSLPPDGLSFRYKLVPLLTGVRGYPKMRYAMREPHAAHVMLYAGSDDLAG